MGRNQRSQIEMTAGEVSLLLDQSRTCSTELGGTNGPHIDGPGLPGPG